MYLNFVCLSVFPHIFEYGYRDSFLLEKSDEWTSEGTIMDLSTILRISSVRSARSESEQPYANGLFAFDSPLVLNVRPYLIILMMLASGVNFSQLEEKEEMFPPLYKGSKESKKFLLTCIWG